MQLILAIICTFLAASFHTFSQNNYEISKIKIRGNKSFSKATLLEQTAMYETNFFQRRIQKKEAALYNKEFIESDLARIKTFYQSRGFLDAQIRLDSLAVNDEKQRVNIAISVDENEAVLIGNISVNVESGGNKTEYERILRGIDKNMTLTQGERFCDEDLYSDIENINTRFANAGYVYAKIDYDLNLKTDSNRVDISYNIAPNTICRMGETAITGNTHIKEKVIRRQLTYNEGDTYSKRELENTRKQLYNLQLFRIVSITPQLNKTNRQNPVPVQIIIQEMPQWDTKFGVGYGTEDRFRAFGNFTYRGLFGATSRITLQAKHSYLMPYYLGLSWTEPQFLQRKISVSVNPYAKQENEPGYNAHFLGAYFPVGYKLSEKISVTHAYYIEKVTQDATGSDTYDFSEEKMLYSKSGISTSLTFNNALPDISPVKGWVACLSGKINGYVFGSDFNYSTLKMDVRKYQKIEKFVVSGRVMFGGVYSSDPSGFVPVEDRFYSGGSMSNRGWARSGLGPKRDNGTPTGGKSIIETNIEIRRPVFWKIDLAAFVDAGNVWQDAYKYRFDNFACAVGGGIRIDTPIGPIRFDVGFPVNNEKKTPQFFLSVGQAF
ncbi:MAG: outer membrane protein assembly factor BamA [Prevotellaceae bacterium]|nr:outer membrane protein assembly factor BamA [Prevotellaceae bacterium]